MSDNYLSIDEISRLADALRESPTTSYVNIGVNMGNDMVEIFTVDNYGNIYSRFMSSPELNSSNPEVKVMKEKFITAFNNLVAEGASGEMKVGKLCAAMILVKRKNWSPSWYFYRVPDVYRSARVLNYSLHPQSMSPMSTIHDSPTVMFERTTPNLPKSQTKQGSGNNTKGKAPYEKQTSQNTRKTTPQQPDRSSKAGPPTQLFGGIVSPINTGESLVQSTFPTPSIKETTLNVIQSEKSKLVKMITSSISSIPFVMIICDKKTGVCTFRPIDPNERFETSPYQCCPFHTGKSYDSFGIISESVRSKISGPYGYFTKSSECFDYCYLSSASVINTEETDEITNQRAAISKILTTIESDIRSFNTLVAANETSAREAVQCLQNESVTKSELINALGENADKNTQVMQLVVTNPLLQKEKREVRTGRALSIDYIFPDLPIMHYKCMSSIFGNMENVTNSIDTVTVGGEIEVSLDEDMVIPITIPQVAKNLIVKSVPGVRDGIVSTPIEISNTSDRLQIKFVNYPVVFQLPDSVNICRRIRGDTNIGGFGRILAKINIIPEFDSDSYRGAIFNNGTRIARLMGIHHLVAKNFKIIMGLGACDLSKYERIIEFIYGRGNLDLTVEHSQSNKYNINPDNLQSTIESLRDSLDAVNEDGTKPGVVSFLLDGMYELHVARSVAESVLKQLHNIPLIEDGNVILDSSSNTYTIPIDSIDTFFAELTSNVSGLSQRAKKEDREQNATVAKLSSLRMDQDEDDGWTTFCSYQSEIKDNGFDDEIKSVLSSFGTVRSKKSKSSQRSQKKSWRNKVSDDQSEVDDATETGTVVSVVTEATSVQSEYNTRYFNETFAVMGYNFDGFEAEDLISRYFNIKQFDISSGFVKVSISEIPLIDENIVYLVSTLFETEPEIIETIYVDGELVDRQFALLNILFNSPAKYFGFNDERVKLNSELALLNPLKARQEYEFGIPLMEAKRGRLLNTYLTHIEAIDKTAILARKATIESLGNELFRSIFTGFQTTEDGVKQDVNSTNKHIVVPVAGEIFRRRLQLVDLYSQVILPFLQRISPQDSINDRMSSFYNYVYDYALYSEGSNYVNDSEMPVPTNPFYSKELSQYSDHLFNEIIDEFVPVEMRVQPLNTTVANSDFTDVVEVLFQGASSVSFTIANSKILGAFSVPRFSGVVLKLGFMIKFFDILNVIHVDPDRLSDLMILLARCNKYCNGIVSGEIGNKVKDGLPTIANLPNAMVSLEDDIHHVLLKLGEKEYKGKKYNIAKMFKTFISAFPNLVEIFNERRMRMRDYVKFLISRLYNVKYLRGQVVPDLKFESFTDIEVAENNGNVYRKNPDHIDVIEMAIEKVMTLINTLQKEKIDTSVRTSEGIPVLDLNKRYMLYLKFCDALVASSGNNEFQSIKIAMSYYLLSIFEKSDYDRFLLTNYNTIMNSLGFNCSLANFRTTQDSLYNSLKDMNEIKANKVEATNSVARISAQIKKTDEKIEVMKLTLIDTFIEYVSIIDTIVKSYSTQKKSYGSDNSIFKELIDNIKLQIESVKQSYMKVNNIEMKIILAIFDDNFSLYETRKSFFRDFKYSVDNISAYDSLVVDAIKLVKVNAKLSFPDQITALNEKLAKYGLTISSTIADLENITRDFTTEKRSEVSVLFFKCKYAFSVFKTLKNELREIKSKLCKTKIPGIQLPSREDQPKVNDYGSRLNYKFDSMLVDEFTNNDVTVLSKSCYQLLDTMYQGLRVIDCGPGLHLLSDACEEFMMVLNKQRNGIDATDDFVRFRNVFQRFITFSGKTVQDIIQSSEFRVFVDVINGKMELFSSFKNSIPYYNTSRNPFPVYENITSSFVSALLVTMNELSVMSYAPLSTIIEKMNTNGTQSYTEDNPTLLIDTIGDFNNAIIPFIDEYIDDNYNVLNDTQVMALRQNYNLRTTGKFMDRMFEKLNYCILKFITTRENDLETRIIEKFTIYIELFMSKMKSLKKLEKFMIKR